MTRYRVKAEHPRRPGPLRITDKDGRVLAVSGETCDHLTADQIASMLRNGYLDVESSTPAEEPE